MPSCSGYYWQRGEAEWFRRNFPAISFSSGNCNSRRSLYSFSYSQATENPSGPLDDTELDLIALFQTITKLSFVSGALSLLPPMERLLGFPSPQIPKSSSKKDNLSKLEPFKKKELHRTSIRNENAYHLCVTMLSKYANLPFKKEEKKVFVCGDSHCTSLAWHSLDFMDEPHQMQPLLVTGMKIWHLRPDSFFYPKVQFQNVIKKGQFLSLNFVSLVLAINSIPITSKQ